MIVHIESRDPDDPIRRPIVRVIIDQYEQLPDEMDSVRALLYDATLSLPRHTSELEIVRLKTKEKKE